MNFVRLIVILVFGAIGGTLLDRIHTSWHVIVYTPASMGSQAWWTPLVMGGAAVGLCGVYEVFRRVFHEPADGSPAEFLIAALWFVSVYLASGMFAAYPVALTIGFTAAFIARALSQPPSRAMWAQAITAAVVGTLAEIGLTQIHAFYYTHPNLFGVALWLPGLYLHGGLLGREVDRRWPL